MRSKRFNRPLYSINFFSNKILVKCPKCSDKAVVKVERVEDRCYRYKKRFICPSCKLALNSGWEGKYRGFIEIHCGFCGSKIDYSTKPIRKTFDKTAFECPKCKVTKIYPLKWYRYSCQKGFEPFFGLELWLQIDVRGYSLWAYNIEHLEYLKDYISALLREDDDRSKYSIVTNLPKWMKSVKNRELILKKIDILTSIFYGS